VRRKVSAAYYGVVTVRTHNRFGRLYMAAIDYVHRRHISPAMLRMAVAHALAPELVQATVPTQTALVG